MINVDFRLKVRHFFKKYRKVIIIVALIWTLVIVFNLYLRRLRQTQPPTTTYQPNVAVLDSSSTVPDKVSESFDNFIEKYVEYCNTGNYKEAYNLVSEDCKKNYFNNDYDAYVEYVRNKFNAKRCYAIQNYSNYNDKYIYSVKLFEDFLATGLTNSDYQYQEEFIIASYNENDELEFSVGNYIETKELNSVASNDYLKVTLESVTVKYSYEIYEIKIVNRTDNIVVIQDQIEANEVQLVVDGDYRTTANYDIEVVLAPHDERTISLAFPKFYDSNTTSDTIVFSSVRVLPEYSGLYENAEAEIENAIDTFSMNIPIQ